MSTEQPTGLQLAVKLLAQIGDEQSDAAIAAVHDLADEHAQRVTMQHHACDLAQRVADLEAALKTVHEQVDDWHRKAIEAREERDELRAKHDELLVALHGIGKALGIPEGERSPYSVMCGVLERVNRLAEIEAQEPVAKIHSDGYWTTRRGYDQLPGGKAFLSVYARPVPARAAPDPVELLRSLGPKPWETSPEAHAQARLISDFADALAANGLEVRRG